MENVITQLTFETRDGNRFGWSATPAAGPTRAIIVALHGLGARHQQFEPLARHLAPRGISVWGFDQRSQGLDPDLTRRGARLEIEHMLNDLEDFTAFASTQSPGVPVILAGDSMGAQLSAVALTRPAIAEHFVAALLFVPVTALRNQNPAWTGQLLRLIGNIAPSLRINPKWFVQSRVNPMPLSRVPERQHELDTAPYRLREFSPGFLSAMGDLIDLAGTAGPQITRPVALFSAGQDLFITKAQSDTFFESLASPNKMHFHYLAAHHDILHDPDQPQLLADVTAWLDAQLGGSCKAAENAKNY